ncbi:MAG: DUF6502 family protein [Pseudomonadota bacterium]
MTRILRPLVRLLIHYQVSFPFINQRLKVLYLDVADAEFEPVQGRRTDSRLSFLTGVHRKDVRRYREDQHSFLSEDRKSVSMAAHVIATWMSVPPYCDGQGQPQDLYRSRAQGEPSFEDLVDAISRQDMRARAVYDELLSNHTIIELPLERVALNIQAYIPNENFAAKADFFARALTEHLAAGAHNLRGESPAWLERGVYANNLTSAQISQLHSFAVQRSQVLLREINQKAKQLQKQNEGGQESLYKFHYGVFFNAQSQAKNSNE